MRCSVKKYCFNKRKYSYLNKVHDAIVKNYKKGNKALGYYICPHCLDYHLTSKYDNRSFELRVRCLLPDWSEKQKRKRKNQVNNLMQARMSEMLKFTRKRAGNNWKGRAELPFKIKPETLPLQKQREIFRTMQNSA